MTAKGACLACRTRKVKCIPGPTQRCGRCVRLGLEGCVYGEINLKRGVGKILRMGEACIRCRTKKIKCDAKRPCTKCVNAQGASGCEYEATSGPGSPQFLSWNESSPSRPRGIAQERWAVREAGPEPPTKTPVATVTQLGPEIAPPGRPLICSLSRNSPSSSSESRPHALNKAKARDPPWVTPPPFSVPLSLIFPGISPEPHVTLSFQLSEEALGELDMKFRLKTACRLHKLGIRFSYKKQQALLRGDTSGTAIDPFFVHSAQSLGMHFYEGMENYPAMIRLQARYIQRCLESLVDIFKEHDWELRAQAALWVTAACTILWANDFAFVYIQRCCDAVNAAKLQFVPMYGRPPELSDDLHEKFSVLSQIIYFENFAFLACGGAEPTVTARIEKEFRNQLQEVYPVLFKICPLTMRTQAILLVRDTVVMLNLRPTDDIHLSIWSQSCDRLMTHLGNYSQTLLSNLRRFQDLGDKSGAEMIRGSCVECLAHLAVLCKALSKVGPPPQTELDTLCDSTLERLGELAGDMYMEEYTHLDLLLGLSWKKALGVFDVRLTEVPLERGTKLRHWREIVAGVHLDFEAKIPDPRSPALVARAIWEDGRTEGSRYPNLMLPGMKQKYGV